MVPPPSASGYGRGYLQYLVWLRRRAPSKGLGVGTPRGSQGVPQRGTPGGPQGGLLRPLPPTPLGPPRGGSPGIPQGELWGILGDPPLGVPRRWGGGVGVPWYPGTRGWVGRDGLWWGRAPTNPSPFPSPPRGSGGARRGPGPPLSIPHFLGYPPLGGGYPMGPPWGPPGDGWVGVLDGAPMGAPWGPHGGPRGMGG